jgi:hypothetical protein
MQHFRVLEQRRQIYFRVCDCPLCLDRGCWGLLANEHTIRLVFVSTYRYLSLGCLYLEQSKNMSRYPLQVVALFVPSTYDSDVQSADDPARCGSRRVYPSRLTKEFQMIDGVRFSKLKGWVPVARDKTAHWTKVNFHMLYKSQHIAQGCPLFWNYCARSSQHWCKADVWRSCITTSIRLHQHRQWDPRLSTRYL